MAEEKKKVTLICSRGTLDGAYPPLILALSAVRAGADTSVYFTFGGIDAIRRGNISGLKFFPPGFLGAIPGMTRLATWMMKKKVNAAGIPELQDLLDMCKYEGVKLIACKMTMDMMELKKEDLVEEAEIADAPTYMKIALSSDINMFI